MRLTVVPVWDGRPQLSVERNSCGNSRPRLSVQRSSCGDGRPRLSVQRSSTPSHQPDKLTDPKSGEVFSSHSPIMTIL